MANANPLRARWRRALTAPLLVILGCSDLARGFPDATTDATTDASVDVPRTDAVITDAPIADTGDGTLPDVAREDRAVPPDAPATVDAPTMDRPDAMALDVVDAPAIDRPDVVLTDTVDVTAIDVPDASDAPLIDRPDVVDTSVTDTPDVLRPDVVDAPTVDVPLVDAGACVPGAAARLIRPLSGSRITSRDVRFTWALPPGATGARVDFCENRSCSPVSRSETATGTTMRTGVAGKRWWRVQPMQGPQECGAASPIWWFLPDTGNGEGFPYRVMTDVNADGITDALVSAHGANNSNGALYVFPGVQGRPPDPLSMQTVTSPDSNRSQFGYPAAGDFDGDGDTDVAVFQVNQFSNFRSAVTVYTSNGSSLLNPRALTPPNPVYDYFGNFMFTGDFNGDGYTDLAVASGMFTNSGTADPAGGRVSVYHGAATGLGLSPVVTLPSPGPAGGQFGNSGAVVDLNADGFDDLLVNNNTGGLRTWVRLMGSPAGLSMVSPDISVVAGMSISGGGPSNLGDVTGDGRVDVGTIAFVGGQWQLLVAAGSAMGLTSSAGFSATLQDAPTSAGRLTSADFTGDGVSDLVLTQRIGTEWRIYAYPSVGNGLGSPTVLGPLSGQPDFHGTLVIGDFDGNGVSDIVAGHPDASSNLGAVSFIAGTPGGFTMNMGGRNIPPPMGITGAGMGTRIANLFTHRAPRVF